MSISWGIKPQSPKARIDTFPLGLIVSQVMLPLCRDILSHASGGNCRALQKINRVGYPWQLLVVASVKFKEGMWCVELPAYKISDDISVANQHLVTVLLLVRTGPMEVFPEGSFNSGSIFIELLTSESTMDTKQSVVNPGIIYCCTLVF